MIPHSTFDEQDLNNLESDHEFVGQPMSNDTSVQQLGAAGRGTYPHSASRRNPPYPYGQVPPPSGTALARGYYPPSRTYPRYYPPRPPRQSLRVILLVILFAGLLLTSAALIVSFIYKPPSIVHTPVSTGLANSPIYVNATVFGGGLWVQNVTLYYDVFDRGVWQTKPMTLPPEGTQPYSAVIPGNEVTSSITYYIMAVNALGLSTNTIGYFVLVRDFNVTAMLPSLVISAGTSNGTTVRVGSEGGFSSSVSLSMTGLPSGVSASFNPPSVTPAPNGVATSALTISSTTSAPAGTYTVNVVGTFGNLTHSYPMTLKVNPPRDFSISATPTSNTIIRGQAASFTVSLTALNGYIGTLNLSVTGLDVNMYYRFETFQNKINLGGTFQNVTLVIVTNALSPLGDFTLTITATDFTLTHTATMTLTVRPGFFT